MITFRYTAGVLWVGEAAAAAAATATVAVEEREETYLWHLVIIITFKIFLDSSTMTC